MASINYLDQCADLVGTVAGPFAITAATNDTLTITIDGGSPQTITLTAGAARTAAQVVTDINATLTGAVAYATQATSPQPSRVRIRTTSTNGATSTVLIGSPTHNAAATLGFTAGGTTTGYGRLNSTYTQPTGTKQELANQIETLLLTIGWTTISGSTTNNLLMQSALSPPGEDLQMRVRIRGNQTNCVSISIENVAGTLAGANDATHGQFLLPAANKVWRIIANKYQVFIHPPTPYNYNAAGVVRAVAFWGIPSLPTFLQGGIIYEAMWMGGSSQGDTDVTATRIGLHNSLAYATSAASGCPNFQTIFNGVLVEASVLGTGNTGFGAPMLMAANGGVALNSAQNAYRWQDGSAYLQPAIVGWSGVSVTSEAFYRGLLYDAMISSEAYNGDLSVTYDGHTYLTITDNSSLSASAAGSGSMMRGTLLIAVS
jgi:hypothetical protein